jgi:aminobenzoyl-glutamate utilization protein B
VGERTAERTPEKGTAFAWLDANRDRLVALSEEVYGYAEPSFREYRSARALVRELEAAGFDVEHGAGGMPTAFVASYGAGSPEIGLFAEYDATPGDSQTGVPEKRPVEEGAAGYGDAHNALGAGSVGAAIAVAEALDEHDREGRVTLFGTPAEKLVAGKPYLARAGYFDDLDAVVAWHPHSVNTVAWDAGPSPYRGLLAEFDTGSGAHTAAKPWNGTDALDAATLARHMVEYVKEHVTHDFPEENPAIGSIVVNGGQHPTNMAERAELYFGLRGCLLSTMDEMEELVRRCVAAGADVTGCEHDVRHVVSTRYWLPNHAMGELAYRNMTLVGPPSYSAEAKSFANEVLENVGRRPAPEPFDESLTAPEREVTETFYPGMADDVTEFSWAAPTARIYVSYYVLGRHRVGEGETEGEAWYETRLRTGGRVEETDGMPTWTTAALADTEVAHECMLTASRMVAATALDLFTDPDALAAARREYEERTAETWVPLLVDEDDDPPTDVTFPPYYPEDWEPPTDVGHGHGNGNGN